MLGALAYDPKVVTIWDGFKALFAQRSLDFDDVHYSNHERQVEGHFAGQYDVAWNSPLAWIEVQLLADLRGKQVRTIAMRDAGCGLTSLVGVRADSEIKDLVCLPRALVAVATRGESLSHGRRHDRILRPSSSHSCIPATSCNWPMHARAIDCMGLAAWVCAAGAHPIADTHSSSEATSVSASVPDPEPPTTASAETWLSLQVVDSLNQPIVGARVLVRGERHP